jgi:hypothetical protein
MADKPIDKETAEAALKPYLAKIKQCIEEAWEEWRTFYAPKHLVLDARARAAIVYCHIVDRAKVAFGKDPGVTVGTNRGIFRMFIGDRFALRFKKARDNGTTSNVPTGQQRLIDLQLAIPGLLPEAMLNAVYQLDDLQRDIRNMMVTLQLDGKVQWHIGLADIRGGSIATMPQQRIPEETKRRVRAKAKSDVKKTKHKVE